MKTFAIALLFLMPFTLCSAETVHFTLLDGDAATSHIVALTLRQAALFPICPPGIHKLPSGLSSPLYTFFTLGPGDSQTTFYGVLNNPPGKPSQLFIDANHDGDLTDDPPVHWQRIPYRSATGKPLIRKLAIAPLQVPYGKKTLTLDVQFSMMDPNDPNSAAYGQTLFYCSDYLRWGSLTLGGISYNAFLEDTLTRGDFRPGPTTSTTGTYLLIDVNHNGKIDLQGEEFPAGAPFNIGGISYVISIPDADGATVDVKRSAVSVPEIPTPPDLSIGKIAPAFTAKTIDGKTVNFPADYKGKIVLLYFWASYCPDCGAQIPYVKTAYIMYHPQGLEILGVSVDFGNYISKFNDFLKAHQIEWPQICDGTSWNGRLARLYYLHTIPTPLLVDGSTGRILAEPNQLEGEALDKTLAASLALSSQKK